MTTSDEHSRHRRRWWISGVVVIAVPVLILGVLWVFQRRIIYQPDAAPVPPAAEVLRAATDVTFRTADGLELGAWYLPPPRADCRTVVLVLPGNAGNRWGRVDLAAGLYGRGLGVLLVDYRGHGGNPGSPSEVGLEADADAAYDFLLAEADVDHIVVLGESIGGSPATAVALTRRPAGVLLRSPFTDLAATARVHFPFVPSWLLRDRHPVLERVSALTGQGIVVDVVLGSRDTVVPSEQSRTVAAAALGELTVVDADHNDAALAAGPALLDAVDRLVARVACPPAG